ncbi:hypothetical protein ACVWYF_004165 [Hymenobacter sp. UYAg731]
MKPAPITATTGNRLLWILPFLLAAAKLLPALLAR